MKFHLVAVLLFVLAGPPIDLIGCTTAVVSGRATIDGRPLLWKNRDTWQQQNEVIFDDQGKFAFVGVVNAEASNYVWMGVNQAGLCIENSLSRDLHDPHSVGPGNGTIIRWALQRCATVADFERLLVDTNRTGRQTRGNFGVIDAHGGAMMFEVGAKTFQRYNANDPMTAPDGFIVRANASVTGVTRGDAIAGDAAGSLPVGQADDSALTSGYSSRRYCRARELCASQIAAGKIDVKFLLQRVARDVGGDQLSSDPGSATVNTQRTLNRNTTVSAVVFQGVLPGEPPVATTMWTILGEPMFSLAVPIWAGQQRIATAMNGLGVSPVCDLATELRRRNYQQHTERRTEHLLVSQVPTIRSQLLQLENQTLDRTLARLAVWREQPPRRRDLWRQHRQASRDALAGLTQLCQITSDQHHEAAAANPVLHVDFQFAEDQGTRLGETVDSAGMAKWDGGLSDCVTHHGSFRIRRNDTQPVNRYVDIRPDVRVRANEAGDPKSHRGWIVAEIAGWNLRGKAPNEIVRIGFTSQADRDLHVAGLQLRRSGDQEVTVDGMAFGVGSTPIKTTQRWPAKQATPVTFVIELDKVAGNSGEGDSGGSYRLFSKSANQLSFQPLGTAGSVRRLRNGNFLHLHVEGFFAADDEYVDIDRIYYTTTNPLGSH